MPTIVDSVKFESGAARNVIRLVRSGEFYRAYNRSAWLFQCCITEYTVIRKYIKSLKADVYYIGFPEKNLFNNIGERRSEKTGLGFDILLSEEEVPPDEGFDTWKTSIHTEQSSKADFHALPLAGAAAEREVIRLLREYPLESKSMMECAVFLSELRAMLSNK